MKEHVRLVVFLLVVVAGLAAFAVVFGWAPRWGREIVVGVGLAGVAGGLWRGRLRSITRLSHETGRLAIALTLVVACAALTGWATGVWAAGAFVAAVGVGGVLRRRRSTV
jgi:peptidoglycan/LPS O-acetylase OafA/YrhL